MIYPGRKTACIAKTPQYAPTDNVISNDALGSEIVRHENGGPIGADVSRLFQARYFIGTKGAYRVYEMAGQPVGGGEKAYGLYKLALVEVRQLEIHGVDGT